MPERWIGITTLSNSLTLVGIEFDGDGASRFEDSTWHLQDGERSEAYSHIYNRVINYVRETAINDVAIKGSAAGYMSMTLAHLQAAELRGVIMAAVAQSGTRYSVFTKSHMSKRVGKRNVDGYIDDDSFWLKQGITIRKGSREAAMVILAARKK